jgi:hypothetical protein
MKCIKNILDRCGYSKVWISQGNVNPKWLSFSLKQKIFDQFQQKWRSDIENSLDKLCNLPFFNTSYIALYALLIKTFFAFVKLPVLEKFRPRYVNSLTMKKEMYVAWIVYLMRSKENLIFI